MIDVLSFLSVSLLPFSDIYVICDKKRPVVFCFFMVWFSCLISLMNLAGVCYVTEFQSSRSSVSATILCQSVSSSSQLHLLDSVPLSLLSTLLVSPFILAGVLPHHDQDETPGDGRRPAVQAEDDQRLLPFV